MSGGGAFSGSGTLGGAFSGSGTLGGSSSGTLGGSGSGSGSGAFSGSGSVDPSREKYQDKIVKIIQKLLFVAVAVVNKKLISKISKKYRLQYYPSKRQKIESRSFLDDDEKGIYVFPPKVERETGKFNLGANDCFGYKRAGSKILLGMITAVNRESGRPVSLLIFKL